MESALERHYGPAIGWNATEDNQPRPPALRVILHKREYLFPWSRLLFAEEADGELLISFAAHEILINGYGLTHLLVELAAHRVLSLYEPLRADRFRRQTRTKRRHPSNFRSAGRGGIAQCFP